MVATAKSGSKAKSRNQAPKGAKNEIKQMADKAEQGKKSLQNGMGSESNFKPMPFPIEGTLLAREGVKEKLGKGDIPAGLINFTENGVAVKEERKSEDRRKGDRRSHQVESGTMQAAGLDEQQIQGGNQNDDQNEQGNGGQQDGDQGNVASAGATNGKSVEDARKALEAAGWTEEMIKKALGGNNQPRSGRPNQNGVTRPGSDTKTGEVWDACDQIQKQFNRVPNFDEVKSIVTRGGSRDFAEATIRTQIARWRAYNGITGRQDTGSRSNRGEQQKDRKFSDVEFQIYMEALTSGKLDADPELKAQVEREEARRRNAAGSKESASPKQ